VAEAEGVGEAEGVAVGDALRSVVVSGPLPSADEVLCWFCGFLCSVRAGGSCSSGSSVTATVHPIPAEINVAARAHAGGPTSTAITRSHPRLRPPRRSHKIKVNAPRIKVNAPNSATSIGAAVPICSIILNHQKQTAPPGGGIQSCQLSPRQLPAGLGSDLHYPPDTPAASSRLCCPHLGSTYPVPPPPRPSLIGCDLLGSSSFCPKMNEAELSAQVSCVSGPTKAQGPLTSFFPKRNATEHRISSVAGCATGSTRSSSAHGWSGLLSLYFGLFLYQVHIVPTEAGVSRRSACVELPRIPPFYDVG
jgi:hypothetical protein